MYDWLLGPTEHTLRNGETVRLRGITGAGMLRVAKYDESNPSNLAFLKEILVDERGDLYFADQTVDEMMETVPTLIATEIVMLYNRTAQEGLANPLFVSTPDTPESGE